MTKRLYVLPLMGSKLVYYSSDKPWSFAIQVSAHPNPQTPPPLPRGGRLGARARKLGPPLTAPTATRRTQPVPVIAAAALRTSYRS